MLLRYQFQNRPPPVTQAWKESIPQSSPPPLYVTQVWKHFLLSIYVMKTVLLFGYNLLVKPNDTNILLLRRNIRPIFKIHR